MSNNLRDLIYHLKLEYGVTMLYEVVRGRNVNPRTGDVDANVESFQIEKVAVLPFRAFSMLAPYLRTGDLPLAADRQRVEIIVLLDRMDLPVDFVVKKEHRLIWDGAKYGILEISDLIGEDAVQLTLGLEK